MNIEFYELVGTGDRRFSPHCWCTRFALTHKNLEFTAHPLTFTEASTVPGAPQSKLPTIVDNGKVVTDSFLIAEYLESTYPDRPSLFDGAGGIAGARFLKTWTVTAVIARLPGLILRDVIDHVQPQDQVYFRQSREHRFGKTLEQIQHGREGARLQEFRDALNPVRLVVKSQPFLGGQAPLYIDYQVFGALQWARMTSPFELFNNDDPVLAWFSRCLDLYDGMGRLAPGYWG